MKMWSRFLFVAGRGSNETEKFATGNNASLLSQNDIEAIHSHVALIKKVIGSGDFIPDGLMDDDEALWSERPYVIDFNTGRKKFL